MKKTNLLLAVALAVFTLNAWAALCPKCSKLAFISNLGKCTKCENHTSSGAFKLCKQCSAKTGQCQFCQKPVAAKPVANPTGRKAFPKHWGAPPRLQTRDLRPLPGGYGRGSSTLAGWIQKNLDRDAKNPNRGKLKPVPGPAPKPDPVAHAPNASKVNPAHITKVKAALAAWAKTKVECKGNYQYTVGFSSAFGFGHTTTIIVKNNKVVSRIYETFNRRQPSPPPGTKPGFGPGGFIENGKTVGKNKKGAPAKTLDEIYKSATAIAAKALPPHERRYVLTNKQGLLTSCFIMDRRIMDDAPRNGVALGTITLGEAKANPETGQVRPPPRYVGRPAPAPNREQPAGDCAHCRFEPHNLHLGFADNGRTITLKQGEPLGFKLPGNPTTGFTWNNATKSDVVKLNGKINHRRGGPALGVPGMSTASFTTTQAGKGTIVLEYKRVFEKKPPAKKITLNVVVTQNGRATPQPAAGNNAARIAALELEIAKMKDFAKRARFSREGFIKFQAKLAKLEKELADLKTGAAKPNGKAFPAHWGAPPRIQTRDLRPFPGGYGRGSGTLAKWIQKNMDADKAKGNGKPQAGKPTFEQWVKGGKKIPADRVFLGGSPWFDESKGERRTPREVYGMLFGKPKAQR